MSHDAPCSGGQTVVVGEEIAGGAGATVSGTFGPSGGTVTATTLTLADHPGTNTLSGTFALNSGTPNATTIQRGAGTLTFTWKDASIGNVAGANQTVNGVTAVGGPTGGLTLDLNNTNNASGTHAWNVSAQRDADVLHPLQHRRGIDAGPVLAGRQRRRTRWGRSCVEECANPKSRLFNATRALLK